MENGSLKRKNHKLPYFKIRNFDSYESLLIFKKILQ
jgi:hypothetical protein